MEETNKQALNIIIDALSDYDWQQLNLLASSRKAFQKAEIFKAKRDSAIKFSEWILEKGFIRVTMDDADSYFWLLPTSDGKTYNSTQLYNAYINGDFEEDDEDDMSIWDQTLNDGLEDE